MDREYLVSLVTTLKLTEKQIADREAAVVRWERRAQLARSSGEEALAQAAEREAAKLRETLAALQAEAAGYRGEAARLRSEAPGEAARERSVNPDLLEQELLILAGRNPGDEEKAASERAFSALEKDASAEEALAALKAKMGETGARPFPSEFAAAPQTPAEGDGA